MTLNEIDPAGLIRESYRIEGIDAPQCRSIFLGWLLKLPETVDQHEAIRLMLESFARSDATRQHPMSEILRQALHAPENARRRGGAKARRR